MRGTAAGTCSPGSSGRKAGAASRPSSLRESRGRAARRPPDCGTAGLRRSFRGYAAARAAAGIALVAAAPGSSSRARGLRRRGRCASATLAGTVAGCTAAGFAPAAPGTAGTDGVRLDLRRLHEL